MPTPTLPFGNVQERSLEGTQFNIGQVAFSGTDKIANEAKQLGKVINRVVEHEAIKANDAIVDGIVAQVESDNLDFLSEALQTKGKKAFDVQAEYMGRLRQTLETQKSELKNDYQKERFQRRTQGILSRSQNTLAKHQTVEANRYGMAQVKAIKDNLLKESGILWNDRTWDKDVEKNAFMVAIKLNPYVGFFHGSQDEMDEFKIMKEKLEDNEPLSDRDVKWLKQKSKDNPQFAAFVSEVQGDNLFAAANQALKAGDVKRAQELRELGVSGTGIEKSTVFSPTQLSALDNQLGGAERIYEVETFLQDALYGTNTSPAEAKKIIDVQYAGKNNLEKNRIAIQKYSAWYSREQQAINQDYENFRSDVNGAYDYMTSYDLEQEFRGYAESNDVNEKKQNWFKQTIARKRKEEDKERMARISKNEQALEKAKEEKREKSALTIGLLKAQEEKHREKLSELMETNDNEKIKLFFDKLTNDNFNDLDPKGKIDFLDYRNRLEAFVKKPIADNQELNLMKRQFLTDSGKSFSDLKKVGNDAGFQAYKSEMLIHIKKWKERNRDSAGKPREIDAAAIKELSNIAMLTISEHGIINDREIPYYELNEEQRKSLKLKIEMEELTPSQKEYWDKNFRGKLNNYLSSHGLYVPPTIDSNGNIVNAGKDISLSDRERLRYLILRGNTKEIVNGIRNVIRKEKKREEQRKNNERLRRDLERRRNNYFQERGKANY